MTSEIAGSQIIFSDNFPNDGPIESTKWDYNHWSQNNNTSYYGNTNIRQNLPSASGGVMHLLFDTYNPKDPNHNTFYGSEAITKQTFDLSNGPIAFEAQVRYEQNQPGIIGGFFTLFRGTTQSHDEIDFEAMSNKFDQMQTNIYHNQPYNSGDAKSYPFNPAGTLSDFHTYRIEWYSNMVRWLIDGNVVRTETTLL